MLKIVSFIPISSQISSKSIFELAKKYSTEDSPSFVNGILAKVVRKEDLK